MEFERLYYGTFESPPDEDTRIVVRHRGGGKTTALIAAASRVPGALIVVPTIREVENVTRLARQMGASIRTPVTLDQIEHGRMAGYPISGVFIDNLDAIVSRWFSSHLHAPVKMITMTGEGDDPHDDASP